MLTKMLNTAIETEGLIRILRDGTPTPDAIALLRDKIAALSGLCATLWDAQLDELPHRREAVSEGSSAPGEAPLRNAQPEVRPSDPSDDIFLLSEESEIPTSPNPLPPTDLKKFFSLNDRYLYSRELFGGDMKMFDSTLRFLEGISDFSDIEDYFYSELEWNPEDPNVASFLDILRPHFNE